MLIYLPLVSGKTFDETKLRFFLVNRRSSIDRNEERFRFEGFSHGDESELFRLASDPNDEFLLYSGSTPVRSTFLSFLVQQKLFL